MLIHYQFNNSADSDVQNCNATNTKHICLGKEFELLKNEHHYQYRNYSYELANYYVDVI
jgi:hypothetical protein